MDITSKKDFDILKKKERYLSDNDRWGYYQKTIDIIRAHNWSSCLELGPFVLPVVKDADLMDLKQFGTFKIKYLHDATRIPWPVELKYDIFISLQTWEHLGSKQQDAFREVIRVSKNAILSFPYKWPTNVKFRPATPNHANIDEKKISEWTLGIKPTLTEVVKAWTRGTKGRRTIRDRIIYFFEFEK